MHKNAKCVAKIKTGNQNTNQIIISLNNMACKIYNILIDYLVVKKIKQYRGENKLCR